MPSAMTAVSSSCSVAPTEGYESEYLIPCRPLGALRCSPSAISVTTGAELGEDVEVEIDGPVADAATA